ncbi:PDZ domain-containing protein, partial [Candidatus Dependentiae bacterium]|nr:PDZ domain-containing protein [Candidatus Dependentiae bacterium]
SDIALLKVTPEGKKVILQELGKVPYLELGDSEELKLVEPVLALGYPLGQSYIKSTVGVLGGREYFEQTNTSYMHITAPINPGNSGGPLLNRKGQVVGINTAGHFGEMQNMGYIVPINYAKILLDDLFTQKLLHKPALGIATNYTTEEQARLLKNPWPAGVYINDVQEDSVAYKAGMRTGDMLYSINGYTIDPFGDVIVEWRSARKISLKEFLIHLRVNTPLSFTVYRKGQRKELKGTLTPPALEPIRKIYPDFEAQELDYEIIGGMCLMQLRSNHFDVLHDTFALREYKAPENAHKSALVITSIMPGSYAERIQCFYPGDIVSAINDQEVSTLVDLRKALLKSKKSGVIGITTKSKINTVLSVNKLLTDESRITRQCKFTTTPGIKSLGSH